MFLILNKDIIFPYASRDDSSLDIEEVGKTTSPPPVPFTIVDCPIMAHELTCSMVVAVVVIAVVNVAALEVVNTFAVRLVILPVAFVDQLPVCTKGDPSITSSILHSRSLDFGRRNHGKCSQ